MAREGLTFAAALQILLPQLVRFLPQGRPRKRRQMKLVEVLHYLFLSL